MNTHDKLKFLFSNDIKIYPVNKKNKWAVCIEDKRNAIYNKVKVVGQYKHTTKTINNAILEAINFSIKKLKNL